MDDDQGPEAGWYDDPENEGMQRRWDGTQWTAERRPKSSEPDLDTAGWWTLGGGVGAIIGALLPWGTVSAGLLSASKAGVEGDGAITLVLGIIIAILGGRVVAGDYRPSSGVAVLIILLALGIGAIAVIDLSQLADLGDDDVLVQSGVGLWVTLLSGGAGLVGGWQLRQRTS